MSRSQLQFSISLSVSSWLGGPVSNLGEAEEDEQLVQAWRGSVAGNTAHPKDGILIGPIKSDPRPELCMSTSTSEIQSTDHFVSTQERSTIKLIQT